MLKYIERLRKIQAVGKENALTKIKIIPQKAYYTNNLAFQYVALHSLKVLEGINLAIPKNKKRLLKKQSFNNQ